MKQKLSGMNRTQQTRRNQIGFVYQPQVNNNIGIVNYSRNPYYVKKDVTKAKEVGYSGMVGDGFIDNIRKVIDKNKTNIINSLSNNDETGRPGFEGETHAILKLPNGKFGVANYMGPRTNLVERLKRNDPPRTETDKAAQAHDIRYFQSKNTDDIRKADNIFINKVNQISRNRGDAPQNILQAKLIKAKTIGEDIGILKKTAFSGNFENNEKIANENKPLFDNKLNELSQEGYGMLPGDTLKIKILKDMMKKKNKNMTGKGNGVSISRDLGKTYKLSGDGYQGGEAISDFVSKKIIPSLLTTLNLNPKIFPTDALKNIISKSLSMVKSDNMSSVITQLSKTILPLLTHAKVNKMSGKGITDVLGNAKNQLLSTLNKGMFNAFKWYLNNNAKKQGMKPIFSGSGLGLPGGSFESFWNDFKKGFTMVFKPFAKIAGPIATALGQPEIGIPLGIIGNAL